MQERERRWKIVSVGVNTVLSLFRANSYGCVELSIPHIEGLPIGATVEDVRFDWESRCFQFSVADDSFPIVPDGSAGERLQVGHHRVHIARPWSLGGVYDKDGKRICVDEKTGEAIPIYVNPVVPK